MMGRIFDIQRFCTGDGPGIRTTVFFKGCPLKCVWCHNPESQKRENEIMFRRDKCVGCGRCASVTAQDVDFVCYSDAKQICGRDISPEAVMEEVLRDAPYYAHSGGGVTLSGGEPFFQPDFALEILERAKAAELHTAVETCGFGAGAYFEKAAGYTDLFLFDIKETDPERHRRFTGADNGIIMENLRMLDAMGKQIVLRCPIIPGYNDREEHFEAIARIADGLENVVGIDIEPYHDLGVHKYGSLGREAAQIEAMPDARVEAIIASVRAKTQVSVKRG